VAPRQGKPTQENQNPDSDRRISPNWGKENYPPHPPPPSSVTRQAQLGWLPAIPDAGQAALGRASRGGPRPRTLGVMLCPLAHKSSAPANPPPNSRGQQCSKGVHGCGGSGNGDPPMGLSFRGRARGKPLWALWGLGERCGPHGRHRQRTPPPPAASRRQTPRTA
jgi:hypothetical protein